jgi:hypothetical protein
MQAYLAAIGITRQYCILRVLPVDTLDLSVAERKSIASHTEVIAIYNDIIKKILDKNKTKIILVSGPVSDKLIDQCDIKNIDMIKLKAWTEDGAKQNWQNALEEIQHKNFPKDIDNPSFSFDGESLQIPGYDLPYGTLKWQGSSGDRARRANNSNGQCSPDYYKFIMPAWAYKLDPPPLSAKEQEAISNIP